MAGPHGSSAPRTARPSRPIRSAGVLARPIGTLFARPSASTSSLVLSMNHRYIFSVTCSSFSGISRCSGSAKRGSASSGSLTRRNSAGICRSRQNTPAQPSSTGYTPHWPRVWLPRRMNTGMPAAVAGPYSSSIPAAHSCADRSTSSPAPWRCAPNQHVTATLNALSPASFSAWRPPVTSGVRPASPVSDMIPPIANDTAFVAWKSRYGPVRPNGVTETTTRCGYRSLIAAQSRPSASSCAGWRSLRTRSVPANTASQSVGTSSWRLPACR